MCSWPEAQLRLSTLPGRRTSQTHDPRSPLDRERLSLTSQRFLSPLDTDPNRLPPQEPVLSCGDPWAAARARPCGGAHPGPTPHGKAQSAAPMSRRMRFSVTSPPGRRGAQPPASLRGTMKSGPTGQMRSGNPPPGCGGGCARARRPRPGPTPHGKAQSAAPMSRRMRLSVTSPPGRRGAQPPASLRGTMESGPTGQMRPGNPPPGCGGGSARVRKPRPEVRHLTEKRSLGRGPR